MSELPVYLLETGSFRHVTRWENKDVTRYYAEISFDVIMLTVELMHNLHMLFYGGLLLSMGSFVLCMHIKHIYNEIKKRWVSKQPIRAVRYLGHVSGYQPIRDQYFLIRLVPGCRLVYEYLYDLYTFYTRFIHVSW